MRLGFGAVTRTTPSASRTAVPGCTGALNSVLISTCGGWPFANAREYHRRTHPAQLRLVSSTHDMTARRPKAVPRHSIPARLLAPHPLPRFLAQLWGERPLLVRGSARQFANLFSWRILNDLLATHRLEPPRLRLAQSSGVPLDLQSFL